MVRWKDHVWFGFLRLVVGAFPEMRLHRFFIFRLRVIREGRFLGNDVVESAIFGAGSAGGSGEYVDELRVQVSDEA